MSLVWLSDALDMPRKNAAGEPGAGAQAVVLSLGSVRVAFRVEEILGEQEVLVKALGPQLARKRKKSILVVEDSITARGAAEEHIGLGGLQYYHRGGWDRCRRQCLHREKQLRPEQPAGNDREIDMSAPAFADMAPQGVATPRFSRDSLRAGIGIVLSPQPGLAESALLGKFPGC